MATWTTPKTNWSVNDRFNIEDYNRIKNNLVYLHDESEIIYGEYSIVDMGADLSSYAGYWQVAKFNVIEQNLITINDHMNGDDIGQALTFYENGGFITYSELNRIERTSLALKEVIDGWHEAMATLPFRLGAKNALRV